LKSSVAIIIMEVAGSGLGTFQRLCYM